MERWKFELERACGNAARKLENEIGMKGKKVPIADKTVQELLAKNVCEEARTLDKRILKAIAKELEKRQSSRRGLEVTERDMMNMRVRTSPAIDGFTIPIPVKFDLGGGREAKGNVKITISKEGGGVFLNLRF